MAHEQNNRLAILAGTITDSLAKMRVSAMAAAEHALEVGRALNEAKAAVRHGEWDKWLSDNVSMSARSARRYMQLAASGVKTATVADLGLRGAVEAIAAPGRRKARQDALLLAELMIEGKSDAEVEKLLSWAEKAANRDPEQSVAQALANDLSLAWLERKWRSCDEPVKRAFVDLLIQTKQARWRDGRLVAH